MKVLIIGSRGQDGTLLTRQLAENGAEVVGLHAEGLDNDTIPRRAANVLDADSMDQLIQARSFGQVYYLAGLGVASQDKPGDSPAYLRQSSDTYVSGYHNVLEALRKYSPATRIFYASSCHIFAETPEVPQNESSPFAPNSIYGMNKLDGHLLSRMYRKKFGLFCTSGILYNHESHLRPGNFLSQKIVRSARAIKNGSRTLLELGNLDSVADWGHAEDYVRAMRLSLSLDEPGEFIVASGTGRTVRDFVEAVFAELELDWRLYTKVDSSLTVGAERGALVGDPGRIERAGWKREFSFEAMIKDLVSRSVETFFAP